MIVQCEQCRTKFRLDDGKVSDRGVKVRCAKCRHVFTVQREGTAPAVTPPPVEELWAPTLESADATVRIAPPLPVDPEVAGFAAQPSTDFDFGDISLEPPSSGAEEDVPAGSTTPDGFPPETASTSSNPAPADSDFDLTRTDAAVDDIDFGDLAFDAEPAAQAMSGDATVVMPPPRQAVESVVENPFEQFAPAPAAGEIPPPLPGFDASSVPGVPPEFLFSPAAPTVETDTASGQPGASETAVASPAITFAAPEQPQTQEEAPPLAIGSRRRQNPLLSSLIAVVTVLVVGVLGYMAYSHLSDDPDALKLFDKSRTPAEEGRITTRNVSAFYLENAAAGELLVITGEAVNQFSKPRASLQLKAVVFASDGSALTGKTVYAGNHLTREQLLTMPADKIETAMNNQFGDSLVNLEVQPDKAIPFTIVIINPPGEGRDFGVETAGSTVAASK